MLAIIPDQLLRSYSFAVGLSIPGFTSPVLYEIVGGMYGVVGVQGIAGDIGLGLVIKLATVSRAAIIPVQPLRSHSLAVGLSIPGLAFPVLFAVGGWMCWVG